MCKFTVSIVVSIVVSIECPLSVHCDLTTDTVDLHTMRVGFITVIALAIVKVCMASSWRSRKMNRRGAEEYSDVVRLSRGNAIQNPQRSDESYSS